MEVARHCHFDHLPAPGTGTGPVGTAENNLPDLPRTTLVKSLEDAVLWRLSLGGISLKEGREDFPGGPVVRNPCFHCSRYKFHLLGQELRSHMPCGVAKKKEGREGEFTD